MKGSIGLLVLVGGVICAATGCKDSDSISGVPASTPTRTPAPAVSQWDVTYQVVADAGPDFCFYTPKLGEAGHEFYTISISRVDNTVSFIPADYGGEPPDQS